MSAFKLVFRRLVVLLVAVLGAGLGWLIAILIFGKEDPWAGMIGGGVGFLLGMALGLKIAYPTYRCGFSSVDPLGITDRTGSWALGCGTGLGMSLFVVLAALPFIPSHR